MKQGKNKLIQNKYDLILNNRLGKKVRFKS